MDLAVGSLFCRQHSTAAGGSLYDTALDIPPTINPFGLTTATPTLSYGALASKDQEKHPSLSKPSRHTGLSGNTVWITDGQYARLQQRALLRPARRHSGGDPRIGDEIGELVERYISHMRAATPSTRECCVTTLLGYPGVQVNAHRGPDGKRTGEVLQPGSRRLTLRPSLRHLLAAATPYALVLDHHVVATRPDGRVVHHRDVGDHAPPSRGRPLTDVLLTAEVLWNGPLNDGPLAHIRAQIITQATAQRLWSLASGSVSEATLHESAPSKTSGSTTLDRAVRDVLKKALPQLLSVEEDDLASREQLIRGWNRSFDDLVSEVMNG